MKPGGAVPAESSRFVPVPLSSSPTEALIRVELRNGSTVQAR